MPHIHIAPGEHDHTASAFIIRQDADTPRVLFHIHKKLGMLLQPGGHVELRETPWQAVLHEIREETGYSLGQLRILQPKIRLKSSKSSVIHPLPVCHNTHRFSAELDHYHTDISYAFVTNELPSGPPDEGESKDLQWLSAVGIRNIPGEGIAQNSREIALFCLEQVLNDWGVVDLETFQA